MLQKLTPLRIAGIAVAALWPFAFRPMAHLLPVPVISRIMVSDVVVLIILLSIMNAEHVSLRDVGLRPSWKDPLWAIALCVAGLLLYPLIQHFLPSTGSELAKMLGPINLLVGIPFVLIVGVTEELTFRGYLIGVFSSNVGKVAAFVISTLIFGFAHATSYGFNATLLAPLALGALIGGFYVWQRNLIACILGHALIDYVGIVLLSSSHAR
jgi:uncharacterized protein